MLAQKLLEKYKYPYISIDHLKMGLIRSGNTKLTIEDDQKLQEYLWPIVKEMIKTAIENSQHLIVEGCYIPYTWQDDFDDAYLNVIQYFCLIMTPEYIERKYDDIQTYENQVEKRIPDTCPSKKMLMYDNMQNLSLCKKYSLPYILMDQEYIFDVGI